MENPDFFMSFLCVKWVLSVGVAHVLKYRTENIDESNHVYESNYLYGT